MARLARLTPKLRKPNNPIEAALLYKLEDRVNVQMYELVGMLRKIMKAIGFARRRRSKTRTII